jgi:CRISPR-associated endoribonuclease Cas6
MRFQLTLIPDSSSGIIPVNYQYPVSAAIYKLIAQADERYARFLHNKGYQLSSGKSFKLFSFSDLRVPFQIKGDRLLLNGTPATLVGFHVEEAYCGSKKVRLQIKHKKNPAL